MKEMSDKELDDLEDYMKYHSRYIHNNPDAKEKVIKYLKARLINTGYFNNDVAVSYDKADSNYNYITMSVSIVNYNEGDYVNSVSFKLRELLSNCSSIGLENLSIGFLSRKLNTKDVTEAMMVLIKDLCKIFGYSMIVYMASAQETYKATLDHLDKNWNELLRFDNNRTSHTIIYYNYPLKDYKLSRHLNPKKQDVYTKEIEEFIEYGEDKD